MCQASNIGARAARHVDRDHWRGPVDQLDAVDVYRTRLRLHRLSAPRQAVQRDPALLDGGVDRRRLHEIALKRSQCLSDGFQIEPLWQRAHLDHVAIQVIGVRRRAELDLRPIGFV